jgi:hypothetical protein
LINLSTAARETPKFLTTHFSEYSILQLSKEKPPAMLLNLPHEIIFNQLPMDTVSFPKVQKNPVPEEALKCIR